NRLAACLGLFQQHELEKDESPADHKADAGVYVYRNVIDTRAGVYYQNVRKEDPSGDYLHHEGVIVGDHGGPIHPVMRFYHNTIVRCSGAAKDQLLFGLGSIGLRQSQRQVLNNILIQMEGTPGLGLRHVGDVREAGNLIWSLGENSDLIAAMLKKFRSSKPFA